VAQSRDFNSISDALFDAQRRGDLDGYWEAFRSLTNRLDDMVAAIQGIKDASQTKGSGGASNSTAQIAPGGSSASRVSTIPRAISNNMALKKRSAIKVTANAATTASDQQITGVVDPMTGDHQRCDQPPERSHQVSHGGGHVAAMLWDSPGCRRLLEPVHVSRRRLVLCSHQNTNTVLCKQGLSKCDSRILDHRSGGTWEGL
jgi:hypothetical protein